ncbi:MAG: hypothetical protein ABIV13_07410 [Fimbriimonadales bacterium]
MSRKVILAAIFVALVPIGRSDKPMIEADLGPALAVNNWSLKVEVLAPGSTIHVTLKNVSGKSLRAYEISPFASLYLESNPELPLPVVEVVTSRNSTLVKAGESMEADIPLSDWFELNDAEPGNYVCRLMYSDDVFNGRLKAESENQRSRVGKLTSNSFGFAANRGSIEGLWYRDGDTVLMPQENGAAMWPVDE